MVAGPVVHAGEHAAVSHPLHSIAKDQNVDFAIPTMGGDITYENIIHVEKGGIVDRV